LYFRTKSGIHIMMVAASAVTLVFYTILVLKV